MKSQRNIIGPNILFYRKKLGLTQEELSAKLIISGVFIDRPMISKIENSTREISDIEILAFSEVLKVSFEDLFNLKK